MPYCITIGHNPTFAIKKEAMVTIGLVDDNPTLLRNISQNLAIFNEVQVLFTAGSGLDALEKLNYDKPDLLLMDIEMPGMDGIETTRRIKELFPEIKIMMLSVLDREDKIFEAIKAGASGYLTKDEKPAKIVSAIEELMEGGAPMSPIIAMKTLQILRNQEVVGQKTETYQSPKEFNLTKREIEILEKVTAGLTYNQIADQLFISAKTARKHIENIYQKLHVHSKLEAVAVAQKNKWV